jgi:hypothetical protein
VLFNKSREQVTVAVTCMGQTMTAKAAPRSPVLLSF